MLKQPVSPTGGHGVSVDTGLTAGTIAEVVRTAAARGSSEDSLRAVIAMAVEHQLADWASITVLNPAESFESLASSNDQVKAADALQYELGEGPCLDALYTNGIFAIEDLSTDGRWPRWAFHASELGIGASLSIHLYTQKSLGSLNLYSTSPRTFTKIDIEYARIIGAHASVVLAYNLGTQNLWRAIDTRNLIGQAQGVLMERYKITAPRAFNLLTRYSQFRNIKLAMLAEELATTGVLPDFDKVMAGSQ